MEFKSNLMSTSHFLEKHPVLNESVKYKIKYLNILEYFTVKYSKKSEFALGVLRNYKTALLGKDIQHYLYCDKELDKILKVGKKFKFQCFKDRYSLVCDCLFINAIVDFDKASDILDEIKFIYDNRYHKKLDRVLKILYEDVKTSKGLDKISYQIECWKKNKKYLNKKQITVLTTANMSAGKSTLINALVGKTVNRTMNGACTSKIHYIYDKAFEDGFDYKLDNVLNLNADEQALLNNDIDNEDYKILIATYFRFLTQKPSRLCIVDTPGVNSSLNLDHSEITKETVLNAKYDKVMYLVNAENAGTEDDLKYLKFICENVGEDKTIFVLNKMDRFRIEEDSIEESIDHLREDLLKLGLKKPVICPVSSYTGRLAKKKIFGIELSEDEEDEYRLLKRKFKREDYNLSKFYSEDVLNKIRKIKVNDEKSSDIDLLTRCGILCLEQIITEGDGC